MFERLVRHIGLEFVPVGTAEEFDALLQDPHLWEFRRGFEVVAKAVLTATPQIYQIISERYVAGETIVVAAGLAFGARIAQERLGVPLATIQLQPAAFQSVYQSPVLHPWLSRIDLLPRPLKRGVFRFAYFLADRIVGPETNRFRAALGLPPARRVSERLVELATPGDRLVSRVVRPTAARLAVSDEAHRVPPVRRNRG